MGRKQENRFCIPYAKGEGKMSGVVLYFDDNKDVIDNFKTAFEQTGTNLEFVGFSDPALFFKTLKDTSIMQRSRILIFDLAKDKEEEVKHSFEIKKYIIDNFNNYRIPIFVHTGFPTYFTELDGKGTVFKIEKSGTSIETICTRIKLMWETGFLEIFCPGGILESGYMKELHASFTEQFRDNEIEEIIKSIKESGAGDYKARIKEVFTRISIRLLMHSMISSVPVLAGTNTEAKLNAIEHYYRRISTYKVWTGDIFKKKDSVDNLIVLSPRCSVIREDCTLILVCKIIPCEDNLTKENVIQILRDNPKLTGYGARILTKTPLYKGGKIDFSTHFTIQRSILLSDYERIITLSDELTNDVVRKFCSYILRSGVSETEIEEAKKYLDILKEGTAGEGAGEGVG